MAGRLGIPKKATTTPESVKTNIKAETKTTGRLGANKGIEIDNKQPITTGEVQTKTLPAFLGGGTYKLKTGEPEALVKTERSNYGGVPTKKGFERADIVPVSLGGVNASTTNITYEEYPTTEKIKKLFNGDYIAQTKTDKYLKKEILPKYKRGEMSLREAQVKAISFLRNEQEELKTGVLENIKTEDLKIFTPRGAAKKLVEVLKPVVKKTGEYVKEKKDDIKTAGRIAKEVVGAVTSPIGLVGTGIKKVIPEILPSILQAPQRAITSVALEPTAEALSAITKKEVKPVFTPTTKLEKVIFGDEPIVGIFDRTENAKKEIQKVFDKLGINKNVSEGSSLALAPLMIGGLTGLDLSPLGGEKKVAEKIAATSKIDDIVKLVKPLFKEKTDDEIRLIAEPLKNISKAADVKKYLQAETKKAIQSLFPDVAKVSKQEEILQPEAVGRIGRTEPNKIVIEPSVTNKNVERQNNIVKILSEKDKAKFLDYKQKTLNDFPEFESKFNAIKEKNGVEVWQANRKSDGRIIEKAFDDYKLDFNKVADTSRGAYIVDDFSKVKGLVDDINKEFRVKKISNRFENSSYGYRDIKVSVRLPNGTKAEIQIQTPAMAKAKEELHSLYEKIRVIESKKKSARLSEPELIEYKKLAKAQTQKYDKAWEEDLKLGFKEHRGDLIDISKKKALDFNLDRMNSFVDKVKAGEGATQDIKLGESLTGKKLFSVSPYPERSFSFTPGEVINGKNIDLNGKTIYKFAEKNKDLLSEPGHALGLWYDKESKKWYLDVVVNPKTKNIAEILGKKENQISIADLSKIPDKMEEAFISTGGTGEPVNVGDILKKKKEVLDLLGKEQETKKEVLDFIAEVPKYTDNFAYSAKKFARRLFDASALKKYGEEGKTIYNKVKLAEKAADLKTADAIVNLDKSFKKLDNNDYKNFHGYINGELGVPERAREAVESWRKISNDIADKAIQYKLEIKLPSGIKVPFKKKTDYYPYFVKDEKLKELFKDQENYRNFLFKMAEKNKITPAEANKIMMDFVNTRGSINGNLERARLADFPEEFYERDPRKILPDYISSAYRRIYEAKEFGADDGKLLKIMDEAIKKGEDFEEIKDLANRALGREKFSKTLKDISKFATTYNNITKLSLAAVTNLGDIVKPFVRSGFRSTLGGIKDAFTKQGKEFAGKAGVVDAVLKNFAKEQNLGDKFFRVTGFQATESKLRQISANAGKRYVEILYKRLLKNNDNPFVRRRLEQFGLDADKLIKNGLRQNDKIEAAYQAVADSQPVSKLDAPYYWRSPGGRVLTQYKQFAYKQAEFLNKFVIGEAKKGNIKPLLTFLIVGASVGEVVGDLKAWVRGGRQRPDDLPRRIMDNLMTIGGIGLIGDFLSNLQYGTMGGGVLKFVAGPTIGDLDSWVTYASSDLGALTSKDKKFVFGKKPTTGETQPKTLKKIIQSVPIVGPAAANLTFPTRSEYKARTIPIAEDVIQLMATDGKGGYQAPEYKSSKYESPSYKKAKYKSPGK